MLNITLFVPSYGFVFVNMKTRKESFETSSGITVKRIYPAPEIDPEVPGEFPYTRGVQEEMYRTRLWTMRQYAGFSTAEESNKRYKYLLANGVESAAWDYIKRIDTMGGAVSAIEEGFIQREIAASAYKYQEDIQTKNEILVGVNKFTTDEQANEEIFTVDDSIRQLQIDKIEALKAERDNEKVKTALVLIAKHAGDGSNLMPAIIEAVEHYATLGEIADVLREAFGEFTG